MEHDARNIVATTEHESFFGFDGTLVHMEAAIVRAGLTIFARIDHAANARAAGLTMPPRRCSSTAMRRAAPRSCSRLRWRHSIFRCGCWCAGRTDGRSPNITRWRLEAAQRLLFEAIQP